MKLYLSGLQPDVCEQELRELLSPSFNIQGLEICSKDTPEHPYALVEVADSYEQVWRAKNRLTGRYHRGATLRMHVVTYQQFDRLVDPE